MLQKQKPTTRFPPPASRRRLSPRLCGIYLRDALSFTARPQIERCREVSSSVSSVISSIRAEKLPRRVFSAMSFGTVRPPNNSLFCLHNQHN